MISIVEDTAIRIMEHNPDSVVRYRLLRDVLRLAPESPELKKAKDDLKRSRCVQDLADEQWADGGWGAFHSRSSRLKQKVASTEVGVERALALGLDASDPVLCQASAYILDIMQGAIVFPDRPEKNDRWKMGERLFLASTLSLIHPEHPLLNKDRKLWHAIARRVFQSGEYSERDEIEAHAELTGVTVKDSYLALNGKYQLNILGSVPGTISRELERALLRWIWEKPYGIGYLKVSLNREPPMKAGEVDRWLASLEMLARLFPTWRHFAQPSIDWIWRQRNAQGYWDFGPRPNSIAFLPLSTDWRERESRLYDWTTRILVLLRKYYEDIPGIPGEGEID